MGLDDFTQDPEEYDPESSEFNVEPGPGKYEDGAVHTEKAEVYVDGEIVQVELGRKMVCPVNRDRYKEDYDEDRASFQQTTVEALANEHLKNVLNTGSVLVDNENYVLVLEEDSRRYNILETLFNLRVATRPDLSDAFDKEVDYQSMSALEDDGLVTVIGRNGRANIYTTTPRGIVELMHRDGYKELQEQPSTEEKEPSTKEEEEEDDTQEETDDKGQTTIEDQL